MAETATSPSAPAASAPIADLPTGDPVPSQAGAAAAARPLPVPSKRSPSSPSAPHQRLTALLAASPAQTDAFLAHLHRCLSTPSGIDTVMLFLCYTSRLAASGLGALSQTVLRRSAREWIALVTAPKTGAEAPATTFVIASAGAKTTRAAARALNVARRLKALSTLLTEARTILRLWGLLGMYFWGRRLAAQTFGTAGGADYNINNNNEKDNKSAQRTPSRAQLALSWVQLAASVLFQGLENGAYLSSRGVLGWSPQTQARAFKWSSRFWGLYVGLELGRLLVFEPRTPSSSAAVAAGGKQEGVEDRAKWRERVARNLAWAPLTVHGGVEGGFVSEAMIGLLGSVPGVFAMREVWLQTA